MQAVDARLVSVLNSIHSSALPQATKDRLFDVVVKAAAHTGGVQQLEPQLFDIFDTEDVLQPSPDVEACSCVDPEVTMPHSDGGNVILKEEAWEDEEKKGRRKKERGRDKKEEKSYGAPEDKDPTSKPTDKTESALDIKTRAQLAELMVSVGQLATLETLNLDNNKFSDAESKLLTPIGKLNQLTDL